MMLKFRYAVGVAACVCVLTYVSGGWCGEAGKGEITWDDLTGPDSEKSLPVMPTVHKSSGPLVSSRQPGGEEVMPQPAMPQPAMPEVTVAQESKPLPPAVPAQEATLEREQTAQEESPVQAAAPAAQAPVTPAAHEPAQKKKGVVKKASPAPVKEKAEKPKKPRKEETPLERAIAITSENPATQRDTFVINPNRE